MYQTVTVDLTVAPEGAPDTMLNAMAADGWVVHTVLAADDTYFRALMEKREPTSPGGRSQPPRPAPRKI